MRRLARFRADPSKVRVAIRPGIHGWYVTVKELHGKRRIAAVINHDPSLAIDEALRLARVMGFAGINLHMMMTYEHPMFCDSEEAT